MGCDERRFEGKCHRGDPINMFILTASLTRSQGVRGPDSKIPEKRQLLLTLAKRMIDKHITEDKIDAEQEVQLYVSILKHQQNYDEALAFLEGDLGQKIYPGAPVALKIELLKSLQRWGECNVLLKDLLREKYA